jgi:hypothetical protein
MDATDQAEKYAEGHSVEQEQCAPRPRDDVIRPETPRLPVAMRNDETSEHDFEVLRRIAENPETAIGHLKRVPRKIPLRERDGKGT